MRRFGEASPAPPTLWELFGGMEDIMARMLGNVAMRGCALLSLCVYMV
jgi:hypothetical protein